jgi:hypothetical protein
MEYLITRPKLMSCKLSITSISSEPKAAGKRNTENVALHNQPAVSFHPPSNIKPTNHLSISRKEGDIEGSFLIDANLYMPRYRYAVSSETDKAERNNIMLQSYGGAINVDIWLILQERQSYGKIKLRAKDAIAARIVSIFTRFL